MYIIIIILTVMFLSEVAEVLKQDVCVVRVNKMREVVTAHGAQQAPVHLLKFADVNILQLVRTRSPPEPLLHVLLCPRLDICHTGHSIT